MRIAHFVQRYPPAFGGSEAFFERLSRYFTARGNTVNVFTTNALDIESFWSRRGRRLPGGITIENGLEVHRYSLLCWPGRRYFLKAISLLPQREWQCMTLPCNPLAWRRWTDAARDGRRFDIVHATALPYAWPIVCALRLARRQRIPLIITPFLHLGNPDDLGDRTRRQYLSPALVWLLKQAAFVFAQTELERKAMVGAGIEGRRIGLLGMGVDKAECTGGDREKTRRRWGVGAADEIVIGHLANKSEEKGTVDLLKASELAWRQGAKFRVVLAGSEMPNFRRFWKKYPSAHHVARLGELSEDQRRDFYAALDIFALPSRSDSFGLALLEAWANGIPNVAYRAGGVAEVIHDGSDGLLVKCGDVPALASALVELGSNQDFRRRLGAAGYQRVQKDFRWEDKLEKVSAVYEKLTGGRTGSPTSC
jgi:glycosyltransferase involved in cell wall biosynthesis